MSSSIFRIFAIMSFFLGSILITQCNTGDKKLEQSNTSDDTIRAHQNTPELADAMGQLQRYAHKYTLAVEAKNHELATFYFHEVRALVDEIKDNIPGYEGYDIARFMKLFLDPTIEPVETALANQQWDQIREKTITLIDACNSCHNATSHGFIQITPGFSLNSYNQDFTVPE